MLTAVTYMYSSENQRIPEPTELFLEHLLYCHSYVRLGIWWFKWFKHMHKWQCCERSKKFLFLFPYDPCSFPFPFHGFATCEHSNQLNCQLFRLLICQKKLLGKKTIQKVAICHRSRKGFVLLFLQRYKLNFYSASTIHGCLFSVYNTGTCNAM